MEYGKQATAAQAPVIPSLTELLPFMALCAIHGTAAQTLVVPREAGQQSSGPISVVNLGCG